MVKSLAERLWHARAWQEKIALNGAVAPSTEDEAYAIQKEVQRSSDETIIGWKIGATTSQGMAALGLQRPFVGPLFRDDIFASGDKISILKGDLLETEIAIEIGSDLAAMDSNHSRHQIVQCISAVYPAFEIVRSRFASEVPVTPWNVIADGGGNEAVVLGNRIGPPVETALENIAVCLKLDGKEAVNSSTDVLVWDHVYDAVNWLLDHEMLKDRGLKAGDIVMTGSCTGFADLAEVSHAEANIEGIGSVGASFAIST